MLFRPNFCANCGEKIERADWGPFTSRRFCPVCETEFKGQDLIPRAAVIVSLLVGVLGIGAYLKSGPAQQSTALALRQPTKALAAAPPQSQPAVNVQLQKPPEPAPTSAVTEQMTPARSVLGTSEPKYFCGAETKKGTPCSRRVSGNQRCYQHKGMPAMLPADKLKIG